MRRFRLFGSTFLVVLIWAAPAAQARSGQPRERRAASPASAPAAGPPASSPAAPAGEAAAPPVAFSQHLERGLALYDQKDYSGALREFEAAYELQQLPRLLYNMARAHIQLGHAEDALSLFQKFLRLEPGAPDEIRQQAREDTARASAMLEAAERIHAMKDKPRVLAPLPDDNPPATATIVKPPAAPAPLHRRWWLWTAIGSGAVLLGGAVAGGVLGYRASHPPLPIEQVPAGVSIFTVGL